MAGAVMGEQAFKLGDVCVGRNFNYDIQHNAMECIIIGGLQMRPWFHEAKGEGEGLLYHVRWVTGEETHQSAHNLRLKHPPRQQRDIDTVVSWSDCAWKPMPVKLACAIERAKEST